MAQAGATFKASDLVGTINLRINIKGLRTMRWRFMIGGAIFRLGAIVIGTKCAVTIDIESGVGK